MRVDLQSKLISQSEGVEFRVISHKQNSIACFAIRFLIDNYFCLIKKMLCIPLRTSQPHSLTALQSYSLSDALL